MASYAYTGINIGLQKTSNNKYPILIDRYDYGEPLPLMDFQANAIVKLHNYFDRNPFGRGILSFPTGGGKTKTAVWFLIERFVNRGQIVVWIAHRSELLDQAEQTFRDHVGRVRPDVSLKISRYDGNQKDLSGNVILVSKQTLAVDQSGKITIKSIMKNRSGGNKIGCICHDEAHRTVSEKSFRVLKRRFLDENIPLLGLTATPFRATDDGTARLQELYGKDPIASETMKNLIEMRLLAKPVVHRSSNGAFAAADSICLSDEEVNEIKKNGDFTPNVLGKIARSKERNQQIVKKWNDKKEIYGKTLVYVCNIEHALNILSLFRAITDVPADFIVHEHDQISRKQKLKDFYNGPAEQPKVLINVGILTEGTDIPSINTILMARPTLSEPLYCQMVGRGSRGPKTAGGTEQFHIIDGVYNFERHGLRLAGKEFAKEIEVEDTLPKTRTFVERCVNREDEQPIKVPALVLEEIPVAGEIVWHTWEGFRRSWPIGEAHDSLVCKICSELSRNFPYDKNAINYAGAQLMKARTLKPLEWLPIAYSCLKTGIPPRYDRIQLIGKDSPIQNHARVSVGDDVIKICFPISC